MTVSPARKAKLSLGFSGVLALPLEPRKPTLAALDDRQGALGERAAPCDAPRLPRNRLAIISKIGIEEGDYAVTLPL
jgi:hypothetical protein